MEECRHIRVNGSKCRCAALRHSAWCYFHENVYRERIKSRQYRRTHAATESISLARAQDYGYIPVMDGPAAAQSIDLPLIEDISSIQLAISRILHALAANTIDTKRAGLLLYGLQIAAQHQPKVELRSWHTVSEIGQTAEGIDVARALPEKVCEEPFPQMAARLRLNLKSLDQLEDEGENQDEPGEEEDDYDNQENGEEEEVEED